VEVRCSTFEYHAPGPARADGEAVFSGQVAVRQTNQTQLTCAVLTARFAPGTNELAALVADGGVEVRTTEPDGYRLARGDRATYEAAANEVRLTAEAGVEFFVVAANGVSRATGRQAVFRGETGTLEVDGKPVIVTPEGELTGDRVLADSTHGTLSATGRWRIRVPMGTFRLPELPDLPRPGDLRPERERTR
jgi:lipopolysaccharide export system protein LptA